MVFAEIYYQRNGFVGKAVVTNGRLNQNATGATSPSANAKVGYDKQGINDLRVRLTDSVYDPAQTQRLDFYESDRAGSRYCYMIGNLVVTSCAKVRSGQVFSTTEKSMA